MELRRTMDNERDKRLANATRLLSEAQTILEAADYDLAAAYIQMALDQCEKPRSAADNANVSARDIENC